MVAGRADRSWIVGSCARIAPFGGVDRGLVEQHAVRIGAELADPEIRIELRVFDTDDATRRTHQLRRFARERRRQRQQQRGGDQGTGGTETHL